MSEILDQEHIVKTWVKVARKSDIPVDNGACVIYKGRQIAIFNFESQGKWYASQNLCPHKYEMALSRGILGDEQGQPKIACPFHKKTFSLNTGECLNDPSYKIKVYPVKVEGEDIFISDDGELP